MARLPDDKEIKDDFTSRYEEETSLETFRTDAQVDAYFLLGAFLSDARDCIAVMRSVRDHLTESLPYSSPSDAARSVKSLSTAISESVDALLKIIGTPDSPSQLAMALTEKHSVSRNSSALEALDPIARERIRQSLSALFSELKDAKVGVPTVEIVKVKPKPKRKKKNVKK